MASNTEDGPETIEIHERFDLPDWKLQIFNHHSFLFASPMLIHSDDDVSLLRGPKSSSRFVQVEKRNQLQIVAFPVSLRTGNSHSFFIISIC